MRQMIVETKRLAVNFAEINFMKQTIALLLIVLLYPPPVSAGGFIQGWQKGSRQFDEDQAAARREQREQWRFDQEKKRHTEEERNDKPGKKEVAEQVQAIIDKNPTLKDWQNNDSAKWERAVEYDNSIIKSGEYKNLSMEERFNLVAKVMSARFKDEARSAATPRLFSKLPKGELP